MRKFLCLAVLLLLSLNLCGCDWVIAQPDIFGKPDMYTTIDGVELDGQINDAIYENNIAFTAKSNKINRNARNDFNVNLISEDVTFQMNVTFNDKGLFVYFNSTDSVINCNNAIVTRRTGIQLYIGGETNAKNDLYQAVFNVDGSYEIKKSNASGSFVLDVPIFGVEMFVNVEQAVGYSMEIYIPFTTLSLTNVSSLQISVAVVMHSDTDINANNYCWEWINRNELNLQWNTPSSFPTFNKQGIV